MYLLNFQAFIQLSAEQKKLKTYWFLNPVSFPPPPPPHQFNHPKTFTCHDSVRICECSSAIMTGEHLGLVEGRWEEGWTAGCRCLESNCTSTPPPHPQTLTHHDSTRTCEQRLHPAATPLSLPHPPPPTHLSRQHEDMATSSASSCDPSLPPPPHPHYQLHTPTCHDSTRTCERRQRPAAPGWPWPGPQRGGGGPASPGPPDCTPRPPATWPAGNASVHRQHTAQT